MAEVYPFQEGHFAELAKGAVHKEGRKRKALAEALFAPHDRRGRHRIEGDVEGVDYVVSLVGPAPLSVEYGRRPNVETGRGGMAGLDILGRTIASD